MMKKLAPQHNFDTYLGGAAGWECSRCGKQSIPNIFFGFTVMLARYLPFCGRWRCVPKGDTKETKNNPFELQAEYNDSVRKVEQAIRIKELEQDKQRRTVTYEDEMAGIPESVWKDAVKLAAKEEEKRIITIEHFRSPTAAHSLQCDEFIRSLTPEDVERMTTQQQEAYLIQKYVDPSVKRVRTLISQLRYSVEVQALSNDPAILREAANELERLLNESIAKTPPAEGS